MAMRMVTWQLRFSRGDNIFHGKAELFCKWENGADARTFIPITARSCRHILPNPWPSLLDGDPPAHRRRQNLSRYLLGRSNNP